MGQVYHSLLFKITQHRNEINEVDLMRQQTFWLWMASILLHLELFIGHLQLKHTYDI